MTSRKGLIGRLSGSGRSWLPLGKGVLLLWRFVKPMLGLGNCGGTLGASD